MDHVSSVEDQPAPEWVFMFVVVDDVRWHAQVMIDVIRADLGRDEVSAADAIDWMATRSGAVAAAVAAKVARDGIAPDAVRITREDWAA